MSDGSVRLTLHDGETLTIEATDVERVYENLWRLAPKPGAVTVAGMLAATSRDRAAVLAGRPVELTAPQTEVLREAIEMPQN